MKIVILLLLAVLAVTVYTLYVLRRQPGQVIFVPMEYEVEEQDDIEIAYSDTDSSYDFMKRPGVDPGDRPH